jgi:hypothetical protein
MKDSGLSQLFEEFYPPNMVAHMMSGKDVPRIYY